MSPAVITTPRGFNQSRSALGSANTETFQPATRNLRTQAAPIPVEPPVIRTTWSGPELGCEFMVEKNRPKLANKRFTYVFCSACCQKFLKYLPKSAGTHTESVAWASAIPL